jgi:hypothetical protein
LFIFNWVERAILLFFCRVLLHSSDDHGLWIDTNKSECKNIFAKQSVDCLSLWICARRRSKGMWELWFIHVFEICWVKSSKKSEVNMRKKNFSLFILLRGRTRMFFHVKGGAQHPHKLLNYVISRRRPSSVSEFWHQFSQSSPLDLKPLKVVMKALIRKILFFVLKLFFIIFQRRTNTNTPKNPLKLESIFFLSNTIETRKNFKMIFSWHLSHFTWRDLVEEVDGDTHLPTKFSNTDDLPADCPPTTAIWGKSICIWTPNDVNASWSLLMIGMRLSIPWLPAMIRPKFVFTCSLTIS